MKLLIVAISVLSCVTLHAQKSPEQAIRNILTNQITAWNKGNLTGFMKGYWENDSLLFVGKNGPKYGYNNTLNNYKKSYPDTASMGKLSFELLTIQPLATDCYFVLGKWMLKRSIGDLSGHYTLLFRKINHEWVIVMDHSS